MTAGSREWTGTEAGWLGGTPTMWWSHADAATYRGWLGDTGLRVEDERSSRRATADTACSGPSAELPGADADHSRVTLISRLQPRDAELGARVMSTLALVAGGVTVAFAAVQPSAQGATVASVVLTADVGRRGRGRRAGAAPAAHERAWVWATFPFGAVAMILRSTW